MRGMLLTVEETWGTWVNCWSRLVAVAHAWFGAQITGAGRVVFQLAAQTSHVKAEIVSPLLVAGTPDSGQDLRRPHELARPAQQDLQDPPLGGGEPESLPIPGLGRGSIPRPGRARGRARAQAADLVRGEIDQPLAHHGLARLVVVGLAFVAAQHGAQP